jgi:hypothetical protein
VGHPLQPGSTGGSGGGSLALGELLDEYGEELYLDLKEFWGLDLAAFIGGEVLSSCRLIFSMIRNLPEGSRYTAVRAADVDEKQEDIELSLREQQILDARIWNFDRRLWAMQINAVNTNTTALGHWQKGKEPKFPIIGPMDWDPARKKRAEIHEKVQKGEWTNWDIMRALGGGGSG